MGNSGKKCLLFHTCALLGVCVSVLHADQVNLKNGDRITGSILNSDDTAIIVKTTYAGELKIARAEIATLSSETELYVTRKDEKAAKAKLAQAEPASFVAVREEAAQRAWEREQERLTNPRLNDFWSGFVAFSFANASGNSKTTSLATSASATRQAAKSKMALYFNQVYASQSTTLPFGQTANRLSGGYRIDRDLAPRLFVFGTTDFDYDRFLSLDLRSVLGGGLGFHAWKSKNGFLDLGAGAVWNREKFADGVLRNSTELLVSQEFGYVVLNRLKLSEKVSFYPNLSETGEYRFNFDLNASLPIFKWLEWNFGVNNRYLTNPPAGRKSNDLLTTTGIRLSFDQTKR
jgi:putative salt-induced outer membrane protein YdiY